jgi:hypothetical protein
MAKPRWLTLLVTLTILITTAGIVGHFVNDAMCVVLDTAGVTECAAGQLTDGRPDSASRLTADLHGSFNLPSDLPVLSMITLAFILAAISLTYLPYSPAPSPPPPKLLS